MGLSDVGTPLSHEDTMKWAPYVREHGIVQFINLYSKHKNRRNDPFKWGDEIEYTLVKFDENKKQVKLSLTCWQILEEMKKENGPKKNGFWAPEYGAFMIEGTPAEPYEGLNLSGVQKNMEKRRKELQNFLKNGEDLTCITSFPRMGCKNFTYPQCSPTPNEGLTKSMFFPDAAVFPGHPRYRNTTKNVTGRRGEKPYCNVPIFRDQNTKFPVDNCYKIEKNALPDHIYLDSMGFGSGYSCLQVTFQASNINEARVLYDQLAPFCPIMMALTAGAPFHRGFITDIDTRWSILCNTHDCRTEEERGLKPPKKNKFVIPKSRYNSIDCYISPQGEKYNDIRVLYHEEDYKKLVTNGVDSLLAQHVAHLFIRDTISLFDQNIYQNDEEDTGHFENIQSTNWQSMRLKPPPPNTSIGWRVEFRPCDLQTTDFENAAVACFLTLLTRTILKYKLNFLIPITKVDENIRKAQKRDAIKEQTFTFRRDICNTYDCHQNGITNGNIECDIKLRNGDINSLDPLLNGSTDYVTYNNEVSDDPSHAFNDNREKNGHTPNGSIIINGHNDNSNGINEHNKISTNDGDGQMCNNLNAHVLNATPMSKDHEAICYDFNNIDKTFTDINCDNIPKAYSWESKNTHNRLNSYMTNRVNDHIRKKSIGPSINVNLISHGQSYESIVADYYVNCRKNGQILNDIHDVNGSNIHTLHTNGNEYRYISPNRSRKMSNGYLKNGYVKENGASEKCEKGKITHGNDDLNDEYVEMTICEIMNGKKNDFPGIIPLINKYLDEANLDADSRCKIQQYLRLIGGRASGEILTTAAWMRKFVTGHPDYRCDSVVTEGINYDLLKNMQKIQNGELSCPELLGQND